MKKLRRSPLLVDDGFTRLLETCIVGKIFHQHMFDKILELQLTNDRAKDIHIRESNRTLLNNYGRGIHAVIDTYADKEFRVSVFKLLTLELTGAQFLGYWFEQHKKEIIEKRNQLVKETSTIIDLNNKLIYEDSIEERKKILMYLKMTESREKQCISDLDILSTDQEKIMEQVNSLGIKLLPPFSETEKFLVKTVIKDRVEKTMYKYM